MTQRRRLVRSTSTISSVNNRCFPSRSDGANQLAWRRVWASRHQVNTVRLTVGQRARRGRRATCRRLCRRSATGDLALITGWSVQRATESLGDEFIIDRHGLIRAWPLDSPRYQWRWACWPSTDQLIGQHRSRLQDDQSHWPLVSHSAARQIWRRDFRATITVVDRTTRS